MALYLSSINLWLVLGLSVVFLFGFITIIFFCACFLKAKRNTTQLYTVEDQKCKSTSSFTFYRKFSIGGSRSSDLLNNNVSSNPDGDLADSMDASNRFTNSLLRLNSQIDEMRSCISTDSLGTFYSTNFSRNNSKRSFVSCSDGSNFVDMV